MFIESIKIALTALWAHKMRSFLTVLGVIIGIFAVIVLFAMGQGVKTQIKGTIENLGPETLVVFPGSMVEGQISPGSLALTSTLTLDDVKMLEKKSKYVKEASPLILISGLVSYKNKKVAPFTIGVTEKSAGIFNTEIDIGRFISKKDNDKEERVAVVGPLTIKNLEITDPLGKKIKINQNEFKIIGITKKTGKLIFGMSFDDVVYIPIKTAMKISKTDRLHRIFVTAKSSEEIKPAISEIKAIIKKQHGGNEDFSVVSQEDILNMMDTILDLLTVFLTGIAAISLIVGGIGIMNIMLVSVTERTREIGLRKAVGAKNVDILCQFLIEAIILSLLGGLIGITISISTIKIISIKTSLSPEISLNSILLATGVCVLIGVIFGLVPAIRAARLDPIKALRYE